MRNVIYIHNTKQEQQKNNNKNYTRNQSIFPFILSVNMAKAMKVFSICVQHSPRSLFTNDKLTDNVFYTYIMPYLQVVYLRLCMTLLPRYNSGQNRRHSALTITTEKRAAHCQPGNLSTVYINLMYCNWTNVFSNAKYTSNVNLSDNLLTRERESQITGSIILIEYCLICRPLHLNLSHIVAMAIRCSIKYR